MKLREKKVNAFGKSIPVIAIILMVLTAGIAGAALVGYLSETIEAEITVTSPMVASISEGEESWGGVSFPEDQADSSLWSTTTVTISDVKGGETVTLYLMTANIANAEIIGFEEAIVSNPLGVTSADFKSVVVRTDSIYGDLGYGTPHNLIELGSEVGYVEIDGYHILFGSPGLSTWGEGETDVTEIVVTFEEAAFGTYTLTFQVVPEAPTQP